MKERADISREAEGWRVRHGLSQGEMAALFLISPSTLRHWTHSTQGCSLSRIMLALLRFNPDQIMQVLHDGGPFKDFAAEFAQRNGRPK